MFNSCRRGAAAEHKDVHRMGMKSRFLTGLRMYRLLSPVKEAAVMTRSPSIPLQTGLCKPSSSPRTERPLLAGLVIRAVISAGRCMVRTHRGCGRRSCTSPWHCRAGALAEAATRVTGLEEQSTLRPTSCLRSGVQKQPHHQALAKCSAQSDLSSRCTSQWQSCPPSTRPLPENVLPGKLRPHN